MQNCCHMNDCMNALHCRFDGRLLRDIANYNIQVRREHACLGSINRKSTNLVSGMIDSVDNARPNGAGGACNKNEWFVLDNGLNLARSVEQLE